MWDILKFGIYECGCIILGLRISGQDDIIAFQPISYFSGDISHILVVWIFLRYRVRCRLSAGQSHFKSSGFIVKKFTLWLIELHFDGD